MFPALYQLWPFVALFYLIDCLVLLGADHVLLWAPLGSGSMKERFRRLSGGVRMLPPWPGVRAYRVPALELVPTAAGLYVLRSGGTGAARLDPACYDRVPWHDVARAEADHHWLCLPGIKRLRLPAPPHARVLGKQLRARAAQSERVPGDATGPRQALDALDQHLRTLDARLRLARRAAGLSFVLVLIALPIALYVLHSARLVAWLALLSACSLLFTAVVAVRAIRRIKREGVADTAGVLFPLLLSPPNLLRAGDALTLDLVQGFDPSTVAAHLLPAEQAVPVLRQRFHAATFAMGQEQDAGWQQWWQAERDRVLCLARACSFGDELIRQAPVLDDPSATAFCPHCQGEYRDQAIECDDCRLPLIPTGSLGTRDGPAGSSA